MMKGTEKFYRQGPYNGLHLSGVPAQQPIDSFLNSEIVKNKDEIYYAYSLKNNSVISYMVLNQTTLVQYVWHEEYHDWKTYYSVPRDNCDKYGLCGAYGNCMISQGQVCQCLNGFSPKSPQAWITSDWSQGCVRDEPLSSCNDTHKDGFVKFEGLKVPDTTHTWLDESLGLEECRDKCLNNCSCMAYANSNISGAGSGCVMWFGDLIDMRQFEDGGQVLYIRMVAGPELVNHEHPADSHDKRVTKIIATTVAAISGVLIFCIYIIYRVQRKIADNNIEIHLDELDLPLFDLLTITTATHNFSLNNKIGQGGFGPVYKGKLADGQEIAVKRLSSSSGQGISEFFTEVKLIAKLQHRNLVKLLGCCIRGEEKLLVYEFMANGSLDSFIFDFGMARSCGGDQIEGNTNKIVGTYGYMAPEYAVDGLFSIKSDVFSFGILLLEIICGNKNRALCHRNQTLNLVGYAWTLWKEGNALQLIDSRIKNSCVVSEVLQCIHVSLLCVQQYPEDRPTMTSVVQMLGSENELIEPKEPGFFPRSISNGGNPSSNQNEMSTNDELTITSLNGR
ncbi:S-locus glycoprotein domain [Sesbania bispinosa]|nr:S-locus glycoprotein domain [Sesbania bispinosa]